MDFRAVIIFLSLIIAQAACHPVTPADWAVNTTIQTIQKQMQEDIGVAIKDLDEALTNSSCDSLNVTELLGPQQQLLTAHCLASYLCFMQKISEQLPKLSTVLKPNQHVQAVEDLTKGQEVGSVCSLTLPEKNLKRYVHAKCLLEGLKERLGSH